jgi:hypothetical protein
MENLSRFPVSLNKDIVILFVIPFGLVQLNNECFDLDSSGSFSKSLIALHHITPSSRG